MDSRPIPTVRPVAGVPGVGGERAGAVALPPRHRGVQHLRPAILGLLLLALLCFVAASRLHRPASSVAQTPATTSARTTPRTAVPPPASAAGSVAAPALATPASDQPVELNVSLLPKYVDQTVHGQGSLVLSIAGVTPSGEPDDERFFVGSSPQQQILVDIDVPGEPALTIVPGQRYSFNGVLRRYPGPSANLHLSAPAEHSVAQLGYYVVVSDAAEVRPG